MAHAIRPLHLAATAAAGCALLLWSGPAFAGGPATAASLGWAKTQAILGGTPSALQAILAQQQAATPEQEEAVRQPTGGALAPASTPRIIPAALRDVPPTDPGVLSGRPDIFGTVALRVGRTPLDARWHRVEHAPVGGAAAKFAVSLRNHDSVERLEAVNWYVNKRVRFVDDYTRWGRADVWSSATETLSSGKGDCEDFAIAKLAMLHRAGFADKDLYLVILRDTVRRADHAVLVVRAAGHMYLLDNGTDQLLDSETVRDYRPIFSFAAGATFTHGYRVQPPAMTIATLDNAAVPGRRGGLR